MLVIYIDKKREHQKVSAWAAANELERELVSETNQVPVTGATQVWNVPESLQAAYVHMGAKEVDMSVVESHVKEATAAYEKKKAEEAKAEPVPVAKPAKAAAKPTDPNTIKPPAPAS